MKNILNTNTGILILRLFGGLMMLPHGIQKVSILAGGKAATFLDPLHIGGTTSLVLCLLAEVVAAILLTAGVLTRIAAAILSVNMLVAMFYLYTQHVGYDKGIEIPLLFLAMYVPIIFSGGGKYSFGKKL